MVTAVIPQNAAYDADFPGRLLRFSAVEHVLLIGGNNTTGGGDNRLEVLPCSEPSSGSAWNAIVDRIKTPYFLYFSRCDLHLEERPLDRLLSTAQDTGASWVYADYSEANEYGICPHPVVPYQMGSIRDDFDFGPLVLIDSSAARSALKKYGRIPPYRWAGFYDLRLKIATDGELFALPESLSIVGTGKERKTGREPQAHFAYVDPRNSDYQKEMETAATEHLKRIGAWLAPRFNDVPVAETRFPVEASVVIPVRNRARTITEAIQSALSQKTDFPFNVLVVDNYSTDGTADILSAIASRSTLVKTITPEREGLSIGGCWNAAIFSAYCGRYAVQLDSDDLYDGDDVLQRLVDFLRTRNCAIVVGSYTVVDADLHVIKPGLIDHREWSDSNGRNNLLRVNGIGAPRAFDTSLLRRFGFPDVGYGEDYAVALRLSREYRVGRIYDSLYLCRRWEQNTDSVLSVEKRNLYNAYKDRLRTIEILARQRMHE